jgi:hypothetical protein
MVEVGTVQKIIKNAIQCDLCGDIIESTDRHDFVTCKCGCCSVDGGLDYLRRGFTHSRDDFTELSVLADTKRGETDFLKGRLKKDRA